MIPWLQLVWGRPWVRLPDWLFSVRIPGPPQYDSGSKGAVIRTAWQRFQADSPGVVVLDGDVAVDACDVVAVESAIARDPGCVWAVACRMWRQAAPDEALRQVPDSDEWRAAVGECPDAEWLGPGPDGQAVARVRRRPTGAFSHRVLEAGRWRWGRLDDDDLAAFGLGCTYLPWALAARIEALDAWDRVVFPSDDLALSRAAALAPVIRARLVPGVEAKHLHWDRACVDELASPAPVSVRSAVTEYAQAEVSTG